MSVLTAIVPYFHNVGFRNQLFNNIPITYASDAIVLSDESKRTSLRKFISNKSRTEIIQSTLNQTLDKINHAHACDRWY